MKVLIAYPNLPLMLVPAVAVGLFTSICKREGVEVDLFETTAYTDDLEAGMLFKTKLGNGRAYNVGDVGIVPKPTNQMLGDWRKKVIEYQPDLILFSAVEDTWKDAIAMIDEIADLDIPHIVGGVFAINAPEIVVNHPSVKAMCRFEGEYVVRDILRHMKKGEPWDGVLGVWTKEKRNAPQPLVDINEYVPDYSLYPRYRFQRAVGGRIVTSINVESYRGCPYSCTFCNSPTTRGLDKNFLRRKDLDVLRQELTSYVESWNPEYLFFVDDSFTARPKKELMELCELLGTFGIPWWCNTRIESISVEILEAMKAGKCDRIQYGIECGNDEYRAKVLKRSVTNQEYYEKIDMINSSGIPYGLNVIIGLPHETREMIFETVRLVKRFIGYDGLAVAIFIPYHGTELRKYAIEHGLMDPDWISSDGYLMGGSVLNMPRPYLQKNEIWDLSKQMKHLCFFPESWWDTVFNNPETLEKLYNEVFFTPFASSGDTNIAHRKPIWACEPDEYFDVRSI